MCIFRNTGSFEILNVHFYDFMIRIYRSAFGSLGILFLKNFLLMDNYIDNGVHQCRYAAN